MFKFLLVLVTLIVIILIFWNKNKGKGGTRKSNLYKNLLIIIVVAGILFFLATSGKFILPQILQIFKLVLPILTKFIPI